jgi:hypothetical protein
MSRRSVNLRVVLNSAVLLVAAIAAHTFACGTFIPALPFAIGSLLIIGLVTALSISELQGPALALIVILVQASTHFLLGSGRMGMPAPMCGGKMQTYLLPMGPMMNPLSMVGVHILFGAASYFYIRKSEKFWNFAGFCLIQLFVPRAVLGVTAGTLVAQQSRLEITTLVTRVQSYLTEAVSRLAAPPMNLQFS